jgi:hypothetical protein
MSATAAMFRPSRSDASREERPNRGATGRTTATKAKAGRKIASVASNAPGRPATRYPMKVARREDRFRRHLPDRDRVRELLVGQPAESFDEVAPQEGQELVPTPVEDRADLEEGEEQFEQTDGALAPMTGNALVAGAPTGARANDSARRRPIGNTSMASVARASSRSSWTPARERRKTSRASTIRLVRWMTNFPSSRSPGR